jgi:hypothetical protein
MISSYSSEAVGALFPRKPEVAIFRILDVFSFVELPLWLWDFSAEFSSQHYETLITYSRFFIILSLCIISLAILYDASASLEYTSTFLQPRNPLIINCSSISPVSSEKYCTPYSKNYSSSQTQSSWPLLLEIFLLLDSILPKSANDHDYTFKLGGVPVVNQPLYLNKLQSIRSLSSVYKLDAPAVAYPSQFSISCWVFMNHHDNNYLAYSKPSTIFRLKCREPR